jgi:hypothetical protein
MKKAALLALALSCALSARAAPASPDSIDALFQVMHVDALLESTAATMDKVVKDILAQSFGAQQMTPAQQHAEESATKQMMAVVHEELSWAVLKPQMVDAYAKTFSQDEIDAMINFYATPPGQAVLAKMPALQQHLIESQQLRMKALLPKLMDIAAKARAEAAPSQ